MTDLASLAALDAEIYAELGAAGWVSDATHRARGATATTTVQAMISASYEWVQLGAQTRTARLLRSQIVAARFPLELYAQIRDALYALAIADGYIVPVTP